MPHLTPWIRLHSLLKDKTMTEIIYSEMVRALAKPGAAILETLTPKKVEMWHMASCIPGEAGELFDAIQSNDQENVIEELGDNYFYVEGLMQASGVHTTKISSHACLGDVSDLPGAAGDVFDVVKKYVIYNKSLNQLVLFETVENFIKVLDSICCRFGITPEEAREANIAKLSERYKGLQYSDQAAQARADKIAAIDKALAASE